MECGVGIMSSATMLICRHMDLKFPALAALYYKGISRVIIGKFLELRRESVLPVGACLLPLVFG